jgi:hypothetical protein
MGTPVLCVSLRSILAGLLSFMLEDTPTLGSVETSLEEKRKLGSLRELHAWCCVTRLGRPHRSARESFEFNAKSPLFAKLFPAYLVRSRRSERTVGGVRPSECGPLSLRKPDAVVVPAAAAAAAVPEAPAAEEKDKAR